MGKLDSQGKIQISEFEFSHGDALTSNFNNTCRITAFYVGTERVAFDFNIPSDG